MTTARLVTRDSPEGFLRGVRLLDRAQREMGGCAAGSPSHWQEAWLWTELDPPPKWVSSNVFGGYATFTGGGSDRWSLDRVWIRPASRRHGLLGVVWPQWEKRDGDFEIYSPSDAMRAFLAKHPGHPMFPWSDEGGP